jgi:hypothetical protein
MYYRKDVFAAMKLKVPDVSAQFPSRVCLLWLMLPYYFALKELA